MATLVLTAVGKLGQKVIFNVKLKRSIPINLPFSFPPKLPEITLPFKLPALPEMPTFNLPKINIPTININIPLPKLPTFSFKIPGIPFPPAITIPSINLPALPTLPTFTIPTIAINIPLPKLPALKIKIPFLQFPPFPLPSFSFQIPDLPNLPSLFLPDYIYPYGAPTITISVTIE